MEPSVKDIRFDFDRADLRMEERQTLVSNAQRLKAHPDVYITIKGGADERATLFTTLHCQTSGLLRLAMRCCSWGFPRSKIVFATGWGKLYPICNPSDESCSSQNRGAHFSRW